MSESDADAARPETRFASVSLDAEAYDVRTITPYVDGAEVKNYLVPADDLTAFYLDIEDPNHAEEIVNIEPVPSKECGVK
jgi:hypothetical protein